MRRIFTLSAILSGILATPGLAAPKGPADDSVASETALVLAQGDPIILDQSREALGEVTEGELRQRVRSLMSGRALNAYGMQQLHGNMAREMNQRLDEVLTQVALPGNVEWRFVSGLNQVRPVQWVAEKAEVRPASTEKAAYLGVATSTVTQAMREQLKMARGFGLIVDYIDKDSPAAASGLKVYDVLQKLDDQLLINPQQLAVLVRNKKPGDAVSLTVIHAGQSENITARLGEKELPVLSDGPESSPILGPVPGVLIDPRNWQLQPGAVNPLNIPGTAWQQGTRITISTQPDGTVYRTLIDDQNDISLSSKDGQTTLVAKDRNGKKIYDGPYNTDADKAKVPPEIVAKVDTLENGATHVILHNGESELRADNMTFTRTDGDHLITLHIDSTGRKVTIKDLKTNQTIFDGPANSDDDLKSLPADLLAKVKALSDKAARPK